MKKGKNIIGLKTAFNNFSTAKENITTEKGKRPKNAALTVGMSVINGVLKEELCGECCSDKVRNFPSATVDDLNHHIISLLQKI